MSRPKKKSKKAGNLRAQFVDEYMIDRNGSEAAKRAGYAPRSAGVTACRLLKDPKICEEINRRSAEQSRRLCITADRVMQEYEALALLDPLDLFTPEGMLRPIDEIPECARRAMAGIEFVELFEGRGDDRRSVGYLKKFKFADKKGALDSIAKILGMLRDKVDVNVKVSHQEMEAAIDAELADLT